MKVAFPLDATDTSPYSITDGLTGGITGGFQSLNYATVWDLKVVLSVSLLCDGCPALRTDSHYIHTLIPGIHARARAWLRERSQPRYILLRRESVSLACIFYRYNVLFSTR